MANLLPFTVYVYPTHGVVTVQGHDAHSSQQTSYAGEQPQHTYRVRAASGAGAIRAALMTALSDAARGAPTLTSTGYSLPVTLGSPLDLTLQRISQEDNTDASNVVARAVNVYALLRHYREDGVYVKARVPSLDKPNESRLVVKRIAIP